MLKALNRNYLWQDAAAAIRGAIVAGEFKAGERTSEAQLAEQLGVSRAPIRDAVHVLVYEGLLEQRNGATYVVGYTDGDIHRLYRLRASLEAYAIREVLGRISPEAEAELRLQAQAMRQAATAGDEAACIQADLGFHRALCRAADDRWLLGVWETLASTVEVTLSFTGIFESPSLEVLVKQHERLLDRLLKGDASAARELEEQFHRDAKLLVQLLAERRARNTAAVTA